MTDQFDIATLVPPRMRAAVRHNPAMTHYRVRLPDYDRLPLRTYLIRSELGTGGYPQRLILLVKPNTPANYLTKHRTPGHRLLLSTWCNGMAVRSLQDAWWSEYRYIVQPGDENYDLVDAFNTACEHRRGVAGRPRAMKPDMLLRAVGWQAPGLT